MSMGTDELRQVRAEKIRQLESVGAIAPGCAGCKSSYDFIATAWAPGESLPMFVNHTADEGCLSGKRPHCTCRECGW